MKLHSTLLCLALVTPLALLARAPGPGNGDAVPSGPTRGTPRYDSKPAASTGSASAYRASVVVSVTTVELRDWKTSPATMCRFTSRTISS